MGLQKKYSKKDKFSALKDKSFLRRFSIIFFLMSVLPVFLLVCFYLQIKELGYVEDSIVLIIPLMIIGLCAGYWGMRVVLKDFYKVISSQTETLKELLGPERFKEITKGNNELVILTQTFNEIIERLKHNVRRLESTKKTLHTVLNKIGQGLTTFENIDTFLNLILETVANALDAEVGVVMLYDEAQDNYFIKFIFGVEIKVDSKSVSRIKIKKGRISEMMESKKPAFIQELEAEEVPLYWRDDLFQCPLLCAPLISHDQNLGFIVLRMPPDVKSNQDDQNLLFNIALQTAVAIENSKLNEDAEKTYFETISALALAVEAKDAYSRGHLDRVAKYSVKLAKKFNLSEEDLTTLRDAARLHDIGKIGILDDVLRKPGKLSPTEIKEMQKHTVIGEGIIKPIHSLKNLCDIVRHHHEFLDGSGYPDGLKADQISLLTRIMTIADIYDALITNRPYRRALPPDEAKKIMREDFAQKLDQKILETFFEIV